MNQPKKWLFPTLLLLIFAISLSGFYLLRKKNDESLFATVTLRCARCDNALVTRISFGGFDATIGGAPCRILSAEPTPSECFEIKNGAPLYFSSRLFSDVIFTATLRAISRDGALYADEVFLSPGGRVLLSSARFHGECEILSVKVG